MKLAIPAGARPVRTRRAPGRRLGLRTGLLPLLLLAAGCADRTPPGGSNTGGATGAAPPAAPGSAPGAPDSTTVEVVTAAAGFRPISFEDGRTLWGILRGRLAWLDLATGRVHPTAHSAWSIHGGPGVVSWRNETGTWAMRGRDSPFRVAPTELMPGYDGPPQPYWSPDGRRAVLSWMAEWDAHHELLEENGERRTLATLADGYMLDIVEAWLDDSNVLLSIVAKGPRGGEPEYRESGWRKDLAVLDLETDEFRRVTDVPDGTYLAVSGILNGRVLVREYGAEGVRSHWLYDPADWSRTALELPAGRTTAAADLVVSYELEEPGTDRWRARMHARGQVLDLGIAADPDLTPAIHPSGRRVALRVVRDGKPALIVIRR